MNETFNERYTSMETSVCVHTFVFCVCILKDGTAKVK